MRSKTTPSAATTPPSASHAVGRVPGPCAVLVEGHRPARRVVVAGGVSPERPGTVGREATTNSVVVEVTSEDSAHPIEAARPIRPKATSEKPPKLKFQDGKLLVGGMHFPDLVLGPVESTPEVVVEIKFCRGGRSTIYAGCKRDIEKLRRHYDGRVHYFVVFDAQPDYIFLDEHQRNELSDMTSANCTILHYPLALNTSPLKARARKAVEKMRLDGVDFSVLGTKNAKKAVQGVKP